MQLQLVSAAAALKRVRYVALKMSMYLGLFPPQLVSSY